MSLGGLEWLLVGYMGWRVAYTSILGYGVGWSPQCSGPAFISLLQGNYARDIFCSSERGGTIAPPARKKKEMDITLYSSVKPSSSYPKNAL
jgi:hypothetical protein